MIANLYLIGAPKAGTTSVAGWLARHESVYWSIPKEPFYWASDYPLMRSHYGFDNQEAYEALYASPLAAHARYRGDGSTTYLYSENAVPDILAQQPDAKFIVCLRNPVDLVWSYHATQVLALNEPEPDFSVAWRRPASERGRTPALDPKLLDYQSVGLLGHHVRRLMQFATPGQVEFVVFDDLATNPLSVWLDLCDFLELDSNPRPEFDRQNVGGVRYRSRLLRRVTHRPPRSLEPAMRRLRQWSRTTDLLGVRALKQWLWVTAPRTSRDSKLVEEIQDFFLRDVQALDKLLGTNLASRWFDSTGGGDWEGSRR